MKNKIGLFEISVVLFFYILPIACILIEIIAFSQTDIWAVLMKWFVFWGVGLRLFTAGMKQVITPGFTARVIFELEDRKSYPLIRELGFANICFGLCGIISLIYINFRTVTLFIGCVYYGLALLQHVIRSEKNATEIFVTITDLSIIMELLIPFIIKVI
ncbi:MAG: DUF6790 family protein [Lachnotalea sp.]